MWYDKEHAAAALKRAEDALNDYAVTYEAAETAWREAQREVAILYAAVGMIRAKIDYDAEIEAAVAASSAAREAESAPH